MNLIPRLTDAGRGLLIRALSGDTINFTRMKIGSGDYKSNPRVGDYWYCISDSKLYVYTAEWRPDTRPYTNGPQASGSTEGSLWYNSDNGLLKVYSYSWRLASLELGINVTAGTSAPANPAPGSYWVDTANGVLYVYGTKWLAETTATLTVAAEAPGSPSQGDYWYDTANSVMKVAGAAWGAENDATLTVAAAAPESPSDGDFWYDTENEALKEYDSDTTSWEASEQPFTYAAAAPASPTVGDWWYDTENSALKEYAMSWANDTSHAFTYGSAAPSGAIVGAWWYDTVNSALKVYGYSWNAYSGQVSYTSIVPKEPSSGDLWYNTSNGYLYRYALAWEDDNETIYMDEPVAPVNGDLWQYEAQGGTLALKKYVEGWVVSANTLTRSAAQPDNPSIGDLWYDTLHKELYEFNGMIMVLITEASYIESPNAPEYTDLLADLIDPRMNVDISSFFKGTDMVSLTATFDNSSVATGFNWKETGIYAADSGGTEVLYAYAHAGDEYDYIPAHTSGCTVEISITALVAVDDVESITAVIGEGSLFATKEELQDHMRDNENPHHITKDQIGLSNVENVAPSEMEVTYSISTSLAEPASGETMATFMGKVKKAISTLISHLGANNPHGITCNKIGAAASAHTHNASEIVGLDEFIRNIVSVTSGFSGVTGTYIGDGVKASGKYQAISLGFTPSLVLIYPGTYTGSGATKDTEGATGSTVATLNGFYRFTPGNNLYHSGCGSSYRTASATSLFGRGHGGAAVIDGGFGVQHGSQDLNVNGKVYTYFAWR